MEAKSLERLRELCFDTNLVDYIQKEDRQRIYDALATLPIEQMRRKGFKPSDRGQLKFEGNYIGYLTVTLYGAYPQHIIADSVKQVMDSGEQYKPLEILLKDLGTEKSYVKAAAEIVKKFVEEIPEDLKPAPVEQPKKPETTKNVRGKPF